MTTETEKETLTYDQFLRKANIIIWNSKVPTELIAGINPLHYNNNEAGLVRLPYNWYINSEELKELLAVFEQIDALPRPGDAPLNYPTLEPQIRAFDYV